MLAEWPDSEETTTMGSLTSLWEMMTESTVSAHNFLHQSVKGWKIFFNFLNRLLL
jgi:hypothetical protein